MTKVPGFGPRDAKLMLVGEAPAAEEVRQGKPFVGRAGKELDRLLEAVNIDRRDCYITNASLVPVPRGDKRKHFFHGKKPSPTYIEGIAQLYKDIQEIKPNVVVALGNYALWAMRQHESIMRWRGSILWADIPQVKVIPTIHPSALLQGNPQEGFVGLWKWRPIIILDLKRAKQHAEFPDLRLKERQFAILDTPESLASAIGQEAILRLQKADKLVFDIETFGGLDLACVGFGDGDPTWACCIPYNKDPHVFAILRGLLSSGVPKIGQNLMYDVTMLDQIGIPTSNVVFDTMLAQHVVMPDLPKGLDFLASIYSDIPYYKDEGKIWKKKNVADFRMFWEYNAKDICATTEAMLEQTKDLSGDECFSQTFAREMALFEPMRQMSYEGWLVDQLALKRHEDETVKARDQLQAELDKLAGYHFNVRSHIQVKDFIYNTRGHGTRSRGGKITSKEEVLMDIAAKSGDMAPFFIVQVRKQSKLLSNYYNSGILSDDGRARCTANIAGTKTGRLSMSKPLWGPGVPMQTVPKKARDTYIADSEDHEIGHFDLAQAEAVITAYLAMDPIHIDCFRTGKDVHRVTACLLSDKAPGEWEQIPKDHQIRDIAKRCNHAFNYAMGPVTFMYAVNKYWDPHDPNSLRLTQELATALYEKYHHVRPALQNYWNWVRGQLREDRTLITPLGRKREFLDKWSDTMLKDAYSWVPQSTVGDTTLVGLLRVVNDEELIKAGVELRTTTHDSTTWMWPKESRNFVVPRIMKHLEVELWVNNNRIIIPVEAGCGPNWRAACDSKHPDFTNLGISRATCEVVN